jgi:tRNA (guanine-N(7)-)-methyltransferase subunit TRM82
MRSGETIVVADKFGDVFTCAPTRYSSKTFSDLSHPKSYPLTPETTQAPAPTAEFDTLASHENPSGGTLILGHTSLLTAFLLTPDDETYIITADRDEHIRTSCFPHGYMIESFCLGHKK